MDQYSVLNVESAFRTFCSRLISLICLALTPCTLMWAKSPYEYLVEFSRIGERVPGTHGHKRARDFITENLNNPEIDSFMVRNVWFYNIYKRFPGTGARVGLAAHWDSDVGCPGANDGGSGVSLLLSIADTLEKKAPEMAVDLLFLDGEDVGDAELLGSQHFASTCIDDYSFVLVIDMVGDRDLQLFQEGNSVKFFPELVDSIWKIGIEIAPAVFIPAVKYYITDDHISFIKYGFRAINIIDFDYLYWDSGDDTIDKCSKESVDLMYKFLLHIVYPKYIY